MNALRSSSLTLSLRNDIERKRETMFNLLNNAYLSAKDIAYAMLMDVVDVFCLCSISWLRPYIAAMSIKHSAKESILISIACIMCDVTKPSIYDMDALYESSVLIAKVLDRLYSSTFIRCWTRETFAESYRLYLDQLHVCENDSIVAMKHLFDSSIMFNDIGIFALKGIMSNDVDNDSKIRCLSDIISSSKTKAYICNAISKWMNVIEQMQNIDE